MKFRENLPFRALLVVTGLLTGLPSYAAETKLACTLQTEYVKWAISRTIVRHRIRRWRR